MQVKSILNRGEPLKSFVYQRAEILEVEGTPAVIQVEIVPRVNGRPICSGRGKKGPRYDRLSPHRFQYAPLWNIAVFFVYAMRRVDCPRCGVKVEQMPWCDGKNHLTTSYRWFLARWAKRLSWKESAEAFGTTWDSVFRSVKHAVLWGLARRELENIEAMGVDEISWTNGNSYLPLVSQSAGKEQILKHSRRCLLKRPENLTGPQAAKLDKLVKYNLKSVKARLLQEVFRQFWTYTKADYQSRKVPTDSAEEAKKR